MLYLIVFLEKVETWEETKGGFLVSLFWNSDRLSSVTKLIYTLAPDLAYYSTSSIELAKK